MSWKEVQAQTEKLILNKVSITPEELFWLRIDIGNEYLSINFPEEQYDAFRDTPAFWHWWKQIWTARDNYLMERIKHTDGTMTKEAYGLYHNPTNILYRPNGVILTEMISTLRKRMNDSEWENYTKRKMHV